MYGKQSSNFWPTLRLTEPSKIRSLILGGCMVRRKSVQQSPTHRAGKYHRARQTKGFVVSKKKKGRMMRENQRQIHIWLHSELPMETCWQNGPMYEFCSAHGIFFKICSVNLLPTLKLWNIYKYLEFCLAKSDLRILGPRSSLAIIT